MTASRNAEAYIGENLRRLRTAKRLSQQEIADALGLHRPAASLLESGARRLTLFEAAILQRKFGIRVVDLVGNVSLLF